MSGKHWSIIAETVSYVQRYCGLERFQSEDLTAAFRKFSHTSKIWVFRLHSLTSHLSYSPFGPQSLLHIKRFSPAMKLNELYRREKNRNFRFTCYACKKNEYQTMFQFFTNMCRLMTTQLAEALEGYPLYSQDGKGKEAVCRAIFALGSVRWFILEGNREDDDVILFGIVVGLMEDEYGYISLNELSDVELDLSAQGLGKLQVRQQQNFEPVPLKLIRDSRLQDFLARFE